MSTSPTTRLTRRARKAGLWYVDEFVEGITRRRCGKGFAYLLPSGKKLKSKRIRRRIERLAIPPAWRDVWICPNSRGHIQAIGVDQAGRRQYLYHPGWEAVSTAAKFDRLERFATLLPRIRRRVRKDLRREGLCKERVVAAVVRLLDKTQVRVGNAQYARQNGSRGATTLTDDHVELDGFTVSLEFPGKSRKRRSIEFRDRKVANVIEQCQDLDGQFLFMFESDDGHPSEVRSTDVNRYLAQVAKAKITAKDFRTWWGSVIACAELAEKNLRMSSADWKKSVVAAVKATARELGNTPAICRSSYIHPGLLASAELVELPSLIDSATREMPDSAPELTQDEVLFAALLPRLSLT